MKDEHPTHIYKSGDLVRAVRIDEAIYIKDRDLGVIVGENSNSPYRWWAVYWFRLGRIIHMWPHEIELVSAAAAATANNNDNE